MVKIYISLPDNRYVDKSAALLYNQCENCNMLQHDPVCDRPCDGGGDEEIRCDAGAITVAVCAGD